MRLHDGIEKWFVAGAAKRKYDIDELAEIGTRIFPPGEAPPDQEAMETTDNAEARLIAIEAHCKDAEIRSHGYVKPFYCGDVRFLLKQISAAVEREREACAQIVATSEPFWQRRDTIAAAIRDRSRKEG